MHFKQLKFSFIKAIYGPFSSFLSQKQNKAVVC